jgi:hypothetical protein
VGTAVGATNLYDQNRGTVTTATVNGLPITGVPIYVRLWTSVVGTWTYNDYDFKAAP